MSRRGPDYKLILIELTGIVFLCLVVLAACSPPATVRVPATPPAVKPTPTEPALPAYTPSPLPTWSPRPKSPTPTPKPPPSPKPLTSEQTAFVVQPAHMEQLTLALSASEKVSGTVTVIPQEIDFTVKAPGGEVLVNAGRVTQKTFTFTAGIAGNYGLFFSNYFSPLSNKVILLQIQHPGGGKFRYFPGRYLTVMPRELSKMTAVLEANQGLKGNFTLQGGDEDLAFYILNASGSKVLSVGTVAHTHTFTYTAPETGEYELCFDNGASSNATSKLVSLELFTNIGGQWEPWWGPPAKLAFTTQPAGAVAASPFLDQPVVAVLDGNGNIVTSSSDPVTVAITPNTGTSGAALSGTATVEAVNGVATFKGLGIDLAGSGYTLTATSGDLFATTSTAFSVLSASAKLAQYSLEIVIMPAKGGTVTLSPAEGPYYEGTTVTMKAVPAAGYKFAGWGWSLVGTINPMNIIMDSNKKVTVSFVPAGY